MELATFRKYLIHGASGLRNEVRRDFEAAYRHAQAYGLLDAICHPLPRTLKDLREHPLVEDLSDERFGQRDGGDGIWAYFEPGIIREQCDPVHNVHEYTVAATCDAFRDAWVGCDCDECRRIAGRVPEGWDVAETSIEDDEPGQYTCPTCGSQHAPLILGVLGDTTWYRCRACGDTNGV